LRSAGRGLSPRAAAEASALKVSGWQSMAGAYWIIVLPLAANYLLSSKARKRGQSKCGPGSVLRPAGVAISECPTQSWIGYLRRSTFASLASMVYWSFVKN
jgi:hypothetical protein